MRYLPFEPQEVMPDGWLEELLETQADVVSKDYKKIWTSKMLSLINILDDEEKLVEEYTKRAQEADSKEEFTYYCEALYLITGKKTWMEELEKMVFQRNQNWSSLVMNTFLKSQEGILVTMFLPCTLCANINGSNVQIQSVPEYPFKNKCKFIIKAKKPVNFQFKVRIPYWTETVKINGESIPKRPYVAIEKEFCGEEIIEVEI